MKNDILNLDNLKAANSELEKFNAYVDSLQIKLAMLYDALSKIVELSKQVQNSTPPYQPIKWDWREPVTCDCNNS